MKVCKVTGNNGAARVLAYLQARPGKPIENHVLSKACCVQAIGTWVSHLRHQGYDVTCLRIKKTFNYIYTDRSATTCS